ncbi:MAG: glycine cleavage system aminomethyltransferase GcvT [Bacteroidota bacterium]
MKTTPLTDIHIALGAKMVEFAGYQMPLTYSSLKEEHLNVRENVGVFDVSHMGEFIVRGKEAMDLIQYVVSNDVSKLTPGRAQYACLPNREGGIVDDLLIYYLPNDGRMSGSDVPTFMLVVNASNIEKDWAWIQSHNTFDAQLIDISERTGLLAVQGPKAMNLIAPLTEVDVHNLKYYTFERATFAGQDNVIVSATGYTGAGGVELYADNQQLTAIWTALFEQAKKSGIDLLPTGLGARDTLRLEKGYCLYGNDITDETSPLEAGLSWITKFGKGDFVGKDFLVAQKENGTARRLVGLKVHDRRVPRHGYPIEDEAGNVIGEVTSGTMSPSLGVPIGMGYVANSYKVVGSEVFISTGRKRLAAEVTKLPFL